MSCCVRPALARTSSITGMSISTSLRTVSRADVVHLREGDDGDVSHHVTPAPGCDDLDVGLVDRPEVLDALEVRRQLGVVDPHGLEPHADAHVLHVDLLEQAHHRQVGAVEEDQAGGVGDLHALAVEGHVHHAEAGEGAACGPARPARRWARRARGRRRGTARRPSRPALARRGSCPGRCPLRNRVVAPAGGVHVLHAGGRAHRAHELLALERRRGSVMSAIRRSGSQHSRSWIEPSRSSAQRGFTRMPVAMASGEPASTGWRKPTSAPSGFTRAQAKGVCSGCFGIGSRTQAQVSTSPPGTHLDELGELLAREAVVLGGRHDAPCRRSP